ncbi:VanZ family protein [Cetobacterium somerae]|uniref:VanZ family protein n=1 Tax=Cetobacterium sp. NK01 TaxID=2993530 RepID=UPI002116E191|nr:VanZ family protein [Cetobacterium sp. NK01]MCQ8212789.1 VanZ family protein [Cetobacterium sp. NK01]
MRRANLFKILSFCVMGIIFWFSNQDGEESLKQSNLILQYLKELLAIFNLDVRKLAHFTIYLILGSCYFLSFKNLDKKAGILSIVLTFLYACTDEFHQSFVPGRGPAFKDVGIDTLGGILGISILYKFTNYYKKPIIKLNKKNIKV